MITKNVNCQSANINFCASKKFEGTIGAFPVERLSDWKKNEDQLGSYYSKSSFGKTTMIYPNASVAGVSQKQVKKNPGISHIGFSILRDNDGSRQQISKHDYKTHQVYNYERLSDDVIKKAKETIEQLKVLAKETNLSEEIFDKAVKELSKKFKWVSV